MQSERCFRNARCIDHNLTGQEYGGRLIKQADLIRCIDRLPHPYLLLQTYLRLRQYDRRLLCVQPVLQLIRKNRAIVIDDLLSPSDDLLYIRRLESHLGGAVDKYHIV